MKRALTQSLFILGLSVSCLYFRQRLLLTWLTGEIVYSIKFGQSGLVGQSTFTTDSSCLPEDLLRLVPAAHWDKTAVPSASCWILD